MGNLLIVLAACAATTCADAQSSVTQPPLLSRDREIALAESAGPPEVAEHATVYVLGTTGYVKEREGTNGFTCLVVRDTPLVIAPVCHDPEGSRTVVPRLLAEASMRAHGKTDDEIRRAIHDGIAAGDYLLPRRVGIAYMLSTENGGMVDGRMVHPLPHVMFYAPFAHMSEIGGSSNDLFHPNLPVVISEGAFNAYVVMHVPTGDLPVPAAMHFPRDQNTPAGYLFASRDAEISIARSAAPASIASRASIYVLGASGVDKVSEGTNGFACFVERDFDARARYPVCYDPEGVHSILPVQIRKAELLQAHKSKSEVEGELAEGFRIGRFRPPARLSVAYALSPEGFYIASDKRLVHSAPHVRVYAPYVRAREIGALLKSTEAEAIGRIPTLIHEGTPDAFVVVNMKID